MIDLEKFAVEAEKVVDSTGPGYEPRDMTLRAAKIMCYLIYNMKGEDLALIKELTVLAADIRECGVRAELNGV